MMAFPPRIHHAVVALVCDEVPRQRRSAVIDASGVARRDPLQFVSRLLAEGANQLHMARLAHSGRRNALFAVGQGFSRCRSACIDRNPSQMVETMSGFQRQL